MHRFFGGRDRRRKQRQSPTHQNAPAVSQQPQHSRRRNQVVNTAAAIAVNPMYQYALQEYAQTVAPATSNDDGRLRQQQQPIQQQQQPSIHQQSQLQQDQQQPSDSLQQEVLPESASRRPEQQQQNPNAPNVVPTATSITAEQNEDQLHAELDTIRHSMSAMSALSDDNPTGGGGLVSSFRHRSVSPSDPNAARTAPTTTYSTPTRQQQPQQPLYNHNNHLPKQINIQDYHHQHDNNDYYYSNDDDPINMIPDASYEEYYGDAYVGAPIKYVYPSGYQSMRPRGGPWKLSIGVCLIFTWLSVFIVGHCSDRAAQVFYSTEIDDDAIKKRWCGSHLLYMMWVISMSITGLAAAYCSVIGYIKVRDFAVANCRSQPSVSVGKSDYYIQIRDTTATTTTNHNRMNASSSSSQYQSGTSLQHQQHPHTGIIYQADGTPRFWGAHIYRPTQAAVAVTNR